MRLLAWSPLALLLFLIWLQQSLSKEIDSAQDLQQEESVNLPAEHRAPPPSFGGPTAAHQVAAPSEPGYGTAALPSLTVPGPPLPLPPVPLGDGDPWPSGRPDMAQIKALNVKCEKNHMKVNVEFDRPFYGMVFSKGHYSDPSCVHLPPGTGHLVANFDIFLGSCGMSSSTQQGYDHGHQPGLFIENTIIVQYDPQLQEIWDQARRLRCTWYDYYEKAVTFRPFNVDMLDAVTANFLGDNIQCWMQVQVGKGPWASEVSGIVKIGQTMTMVLAIKDDENKFDMLVRNCIAHDGKHQPIQLVDEYGCISRPKIMSRFQKVKNFGASASVVSYAYFQAFKFPDSMNVHFQCVIQVCRFECPAPRCDGDVHYNPGGGGGGGDLVEVPHPHLGASTLGGEYLPAPREPGGSYSENKATFHDPDKKVKPSDGVKQDKYPSVYFNHRQGEALPGGGAEGDSKIKETAEGTEEVKAELVKKVNSLPVGSPRALGDDKTEVKRSRRQARQQMTDVQTQKVIQVVAPGDVAFALPTNPQAESKVVDVFASPTSDSDSAICMSLPGFAAGLVFLILLLVVSCLVAAFLFLRVRHLAAGKGDAETVISYDNAEFVKMALPAVVQ